MDHDALSEEAAGPGGPGPYYRNVAEWVEQWLIPTYRRSVAGHDRTWCPRWWLHAEAVGRLEALWRAWEHLRLDGSTGMSVWFRDHADHHMTVLLDADGPFKGCGPEGHSLRALEPLPVEAAPAGLFETEEDLEIDEPEIPAVAKPDRRSTGPGRGVDLARGL